MTQHKEAEPPKAEKEIEKPPPRCPKCGGELKQMRCRIDGPELYCLACRLTFGASSSRKQTY
jgi:hypothetical protein